MLYSLLLAMEQMEIRNIKESDLLDVYNLGCQIFGDIAHSSLVVRQIYDLVSPFMFVAVDGALLGYSTGGIDATEGYGHIMSLAVDPNARGRGVGAALTEAVEKSLIEKSVTTLQLVVSPENDAAIGLYEKLGYNRIQIVSDYFGPGADRLMMRKAV